MAHTPRTYEVETFSGSYVDTKHPLPSTLHVGDIAHALANTCRYGGHCQKFYSVAEHAVFVSKRLERKGCSLDLQIAGLHHDDAEAYLGDIPRPMKPLLGKAYERMTDRMDKAIITALGLLGDQSNFHAKEVKDADVWSLLVEARFLLPSQGKGWWEGDQAAANWGLGDQPTRIVVPDYWLDGMGPALAEELFLQRHDELTGG